MRTNFFKGVIHRVALLWLANLSFTAIAAESTLPELNECYAEGSGLKGFFVAYTVENPGPRMFKCIPLDQQCTVKTVRNIEERWKSVAATKPRADGSIPVVPLQVFLALKQRGCNVDERDFLVPSDAQLDSIEPNCSMSKRCRVNFRRPKNETAPCIAHMWQMQAADRIIPPFVRPKYWTGRSDESCDLNGSGRLRIPELELEKSDWLELHNDLVKLKLFPVLQRSEFEDRAIQLNNVYQFDEVSLRIPKFPVNPDGVKPVPPNSSGANPNLDGTGRDVALAGSGALLLLLARWLRELLRSRKKPISISTTTAKVTNRDVRVIGRWTNEFAQQETSTLPVGRQEP